jgi:hypothetical protein
VNQGSAHFAAANHSNIVFMICIRHGITVSFEPVLRRLRLRTSRNIHHSEINIRFFLTV